MSRPLQICLMILTAALCGVCVVQWQREGQAAARGQAMAMELQALQATLLSQTERLATWEQEITRLNTALAGQSTAREALPELESRLAATLLQLEAKTAALAQLTANGETLGSQLKKAMDERDALAVRLNERTREYNALAGKLRAGR